MSALPTLLIVLAIALACLELAVAWWRRRAELRSIRRMWSMSDA